MRVAVAAFDDQIAPRIENCVYVLLGTIEAGQILGVTSVAVRELEAEQIPDFLKAQGVETLVCGGIPEWHHEQLRRHGIAVIWGVIGPAAAALCRLAEGSLHCDQFIGLKQDSPAARRCQQRWSTFLGIRPPLKLDRPASAGSDDPEGRDSANIDNAPGRDDPDSKPGRGRHETTARE